MWIGPIQDHEQVGRGVADAWEHWLSQHPVTVAELITDAVRAVLREWLDQHGAELIETLHDPPG